jgi:ASC-1-like (ASCH) protein
MIRRMKLWHDPFMKILEGTKTVEMRLYDEKRSAVSVGGKPAFVPEKI